MTQRAPPLPLSPAELRASGVHRPDVLLISGDAYVDHPSFGVAVVGRLLQSWGLQVAVAAQPAWRDPAALCELGRPRLFVGVTAGNMDSMVNHLTSLHKRRHDDAYSPGGQAGLRPNRASIVYAQLARRAWPEALIILGGIEASLRRLAHYDCWEDGLRRSVLLDAKADLLIYGMAERPLRAVVDRLAPLSEVDRGAAPRLWGIPGSAFVIGKREASRRQLLLEGGAELAWGPHGGCDAGPSRPAAGLFRASLPPSCWTVKRLPSYEELLADRQALAAATRLLERAALPGSTTACVQAHGDALVIVCPPAEPLTSAELDAVHELPYTRQPHPSYLQPIPAAAMIESSVQITRGCFGGCSFCAIGLHEGKVVQSRSRASILREVKHLLGRPTCKGIISDLGGPTANLWGLGCRDPGLQARCRRVSCLYPRPCPALRTDHSPQRALLAAVRQLPGLRRALVASGIRHDLALREPDYLRDLLRYHVGGHLHVAPEHADPDVLRLARKPPYAIFERFRELFSGLCRELGVERYLNPYFISGLPGSTDTRMADLVRRLRAEGWRPRQVQSFLPTPGTLATAIYYSGINPYRPHEVVEMPRSLGDKLRQHRLLTQDLQPGARPAPSARRPRDR